MLSALTGPLSPFAWWWFDEAITGTLPPDPDPEPEPNPSQNAISLRWTLEAIATDSEIAAGDRLTSVTLLLASPNPLRLRNITDADTGIVVTPFRVEYTLKRGAQDMATGVLQHALGRATGALDDTDVAVPGPDDTLVVKVWPAADAQPTTRVYGVQYLSV